MRVLWKFRAKSSIDTPARVAVPESRMGMSVRPGELRNIPIFSSMKFRGNGSKDQKSSTLHTAVRSRDNRAYETYAKQAFETDRNVHPTFLVLILPVLILLTGCANEPPLGANGEPVEVRVGYFPNVTHAQAMIGMSRGDFQQAVGPDVKLVAQTFNAGPSAIEAIYAGHVDIAYVGPAPVLNGFLQSKGEEVRVVSGAATNGVTIVGNKARHIKTLEQLKGGRIATPQYGNTQDISAKYFLTTLLGARLKSNGGETDVFPISNPDIETLFVKDEIDGAWVPEPWGSRLTERGLVNVIEEEKNLWPNGSFAMTSVVARRKFVEDHPELVSRFLQAHVRLTEQLQQDPQSFVKPLNEELKRITTKSLPEEVVSGALEKTGFSVDPAVASYEQYFRMGKEVGTIKADHLDIEKLFVMEPLAQAVMLAGEASSGSADEATTSGRATESNTTTAELSL